MELNPNIMTDKFGFHQSFDMNSCDRHEKGAATSRSTPWSSMRHDGSISKLQIVT